MKRVDLNITKIGENLVLTPSKNTLYVIKAVGEIKSSNCINISPAKSGINIEIVLLCFLENEAYLKLEIAFNHNTNIDNFTYSLSGRVILIDNSSVSISPILKINNSTSQANHKLVIGGIDETTKEYLSSKGLSKDKIEEMFKKEIENY